MRIAIILMMGPAAEAAQAQVEHCRAAEHFLVAEAGMTAVSRADTIDDWRTGATQVGCRVTAAGVTSQAPAPAAASFYQRLRASGWTRTPDPRDAPNEASLRFRHHDTDCLFNVYSGPALGTEDEIAVSNAVLPGRGQRRFHTLVLCMAAKQAAP